MHRIALWSVGVALLGGGFVACSASESSGGTGGSGAAGGAAGDASAGTGGVAGTAGAPGGAAGGGGVPLIDAGDGQAGTGGAPPAPDPKTCAEAAQLKSYVGCEFWPTVLANPVWSTFDFTVIVANGGSDPADVSVSRGGSLVASDTVPPNGLRALYLPWVPELKGPDSDTCGSGTPPTSSVRVDGGAYRLDSTRPVTVYQFNPLEYQGQGGPSGKDWSSCPGNQGCAAQLGLPLGCFSFSNDASLLLPSTAMTGNYRVTSFPAWPAESLPSYIGITATTNDTTVNVQVSGTGKIAAGTGIAATNAGGILTLKLSAGDVLQLVGGTTAGSDLSGSLVQADKPVQVLAGTSCMEIPNGTKACDHIEESVLPAETLGKHYFVARPTGPNGQPVGHVVRFYGNANGTKLSYPSGVPNGAPALLSAGQVFDMGVVSSDFEVMGDKEFSIATFQLGGAAVDPTALPGTRKGDPSQSQAVAIEQWRQKYIFIAPNDFDVSYVDIIQPLNAVVVVDGSAVAIAPVPIGSSQWGVARVKLSAGTQGVHLANSDQPFAIQVMGYARNTSYQYPGGLALQAIAPPPPPVK